MTAESVANPTLHATCTSNRLVINRAAAGGQMNIAITMIDPTASKAATAAIAATTTSDSPKTPVGKPTVRANPSSKLLIFKGRQKAHVKPLTKASVAAIRGSSGGSPFKASHSNKDAQPKASSQIRLSRLP